MVSVNNRILTAYTTTSSAPTDSATVTGDVTGTSNVPTRISMTYTAQVPPLYTADNAHNDSKLEQCKQKREALLEEKEKAYKEYKAALDEMHELQDKAKQAEKDGDHKASLDYTNQATNKGIRVQVLYEKYKAILKEIHKVDAEIRSLEQDTNNSGVSTPVPTDSLMSGLTSTVSVWTTQTTSCVAFTPDPNATPAILT